MPLRYAFTRPDGGVTIIHAAAKADIERVLGPLTDAQYEAHVLERSIPADATDVTKLPDDWTPPDDRTFRDAWKNDKGKVEVDLAKAKNLAEKMGHSEQDLAAVKDITELRQLVKG
jgi:hypothetical protein